MASEATGNSAGVGKPENPWGYYYLRYFVGAIVGSGLLLTLVWSAAHGNNPALKHSLAYLLSDFQGREGAVAVLAGISALGAAGLAFCYIASTPILVLHAFRGYFSGSDKFWKCIVKLSSVLPLLFAAVVLFLGDSESESWRLAGYVPFIAVLVGQSGLIWKCNLKALRKRYKRLTMRRAMQSRSAWVKEYVESYKHLREHGNACLILLLEVVLAAALYAVVAAPQSEGAPIRLIGFVVVWLMPAGFVWFFGTWLEVDIPEVPEPETKTCEPQDGGLRMALWGLASSLVARCLRRQSKN